MPGDVARVAAVLGENRRAKQQDVRSDNVFHRIEDGRVPGQLDQPRKRKIALDLERAVGVVPDLRLIGLDTLAVVIGLLRTDGAKGINIAVRLKLRNLRRSQFLRHAVPPDFAYVGLHPDLLAFSFQTHGKARISS